MKKLNFRVTETNGSIHSGVCELSVSEKTGMVEIKLRELRISPFCDFTETAEKVQILLLRNVILKMSKNFDEFHYYSTLEVDESKDGVEVEEEEVSIEKA